MLISLIKNYIKKNLPNTYNYIVKIRDGNPFLKKIKDSISLSLNKKIHGTRIVNNEKGIFINLTKSNYLSFNLRPKLAKDYKTKVNDTSNRDVAVIIQGSLYGLEFFVEQTLQIYNKNFPDSKLILSVWEDELNKSLKKKIDLINDVKLIINQKPKNFIHNIDLQTKSTNAAIQYAKHKGYKFCLKTRTDCRLNKVNSLSFLKNLIKLFPVKESSIATSRIISCAIDTRKFRVYGLSDILMFGKTEDLNRYFLDENFEVSLKKYNFGEYPCVIKETAVINEIFLCARYLRNLKEDLNWTLDDWCKSLRNFFCIVDPASIDFFWYKYEWKFEQRFLTNYTENFDFAVEFSDWLNLYNNPNNNFAKNFQEKWEIKNDQIFTKQD